MASNINEDRSEVDTRKIDFQSSRNLFEAKQGNTSDKGFVARKPIQSFVTTKSNNAPESRRKTWHTGQERSSTFSKGDTEMANYEELKVFKQPLCLIETDFDGKLKAHQDVLDQIRKIDRPLNIVCIAGPCRTGKSYLLTRLAGRNKGFALGSALDSKTKGIWAWCRPHPIKRDQVLLLLDTEGLGDIIKGDKNNDNQILSLGILLSSTMVYNIQGKFSHDDMQTLSFVTEISKNISVSDTMDMEESSHSFDRYFPTFILTLRDFCLELNIGGKTVTSDEYFEICLKTQQENDQKTRDNNRARRCLKGYFKTRKCFTFDRPCETDLLPKVDDLQDCDLGRKFLQNTKLFTDYIYEECPPKQMNNGQPVNGRRFVIIVAQYVDAIRKGKVPSVLDALGNMVIQENERAVEESVKIYLSLMGQLEYPTPDNNTLRDAHKRCFDDALAFFLTNSICDEENEYYNMANSEITKQYENFRTRDQQESMKKSQEALGKMDAEIKQKVADRRYNCRDGYKLYLKDMDTLVTNFSALTGLGCKNLDVLKDYLSDNAIRGRLIMQADETLTENEIQLEVQKQIADEAERMRAAETRLLEEQKRLHKEETRRNKEALEQMKQKHDKDLQNERDHLVKLNEKRLKDLELLIKEGLHEEAERGRLYREKTQKEIEGFKNEGAISLLCRSIKKSFSNVVGIFKSK